MTKYCEILRLRSLGWLLLYRSESEANYLFKSFTNVGRDLQQSSARSSEKPNIAHSNNRIIIICAVELLIFQYSRSIKQRIK